MSMGKIRKAIASISMVALLSTLVLTTTAFAYSDVPADHWGYSYVEALKTAGAVDDADKFRPDDNIVRAEVAKIVAEYLMLEGDTLGSSMFSDSVAGTWYDSYIGIMAQYGIMTGDQGKDTVRPGDNVNRAEVAKMLVEANGLESAGMMGSDVFPDVEAGAWYDEYMGTAYCYGIVGGYQDGTAGPARNASRVEFAKMAVKASEGVLVEACDGTVTPPPVGASDVTVSVSSMTPETDSVPSQASSVSFAAFDFTAGDDGAVIDEVEVTRGGVSANSSFAGVYLYDENGVRLTSKKSLNSDTNSATFSALNLSVEGGETVTLFVRADMADNSTSGEAYFEITSASSVTTNGGEVSGDFPVRGEKMGVSTTDAGEVTVTKSGSIPAPSIGQQGAKIAEFKLAASGEDAMVHELSVTVKGDVSEDAYSNFELKDQAGQTIASAEGISGDNLATFILDTPYEIEDGSSRIFRVYADLGGDAGDDVKVYFDADADVVAIGGDYSFGMAVDRGDAGTDSGTYDGASCTSSGGDCSWSELEGGDVTLAFNGPTAQDVSIGGDNVHLLEFSLSSAGEISVENLDVIVYADDDGDDDPFDALEGGGADTDGLIETGLTVANLTDIKVIDTDTGRTVMSSQELTLAGDDADQTLSFDDAFTVEGGETLHLAVVADVGENIAAETEIGATIDISGLSVEDVNGDAVASSEIVPSTDMVGNILTTVDAELFTTIGSTPVSDTYVKGTKDVPVVGVNFRASDAEDIKVTQLTLQGYLDVDSDGYNDVSAGVDGAGSQSVKDFVSSVSLYVGTEKIAGPEAVETDGDVLFSNMDWTIEAGETEKLIVKADLSKPSSVSNDLVAFGIAAVADVVAQDLDGDSVDASATVNTAQTVALTVKDSGTLSFSEEGGPDAKVLVSGTDDVLVSKYKFEAVDEAFKVKDLELFASTSGSATTAAVTTYSRVFEGVKIKYTDSTGAAVTKSGNFAAGEAVFSGLDFYVPKDGSAYVEIYADLNDTTAGAVTGDQVRVVIDENTLVASNEFEATGVGSGQTINAASSSLTYPTNEADVAAHYLRRTEPTVTKSTGLSTDLSNGTVTLYGVTVAANSAKAVALKSLNFKVTGSFSDNADGLASFKFFRGSTDITDDVRIVLATATDGGLSVGQDMESVTQANFTDAGLSFDYKVQVEFNDSATAEETVSAGGSSTYYLKATAGGVDSSSDSVTAYIADDTSQLTRTTAIMDTTKLKYHTAAVGGAEAAALSLFYDLYGDTTASDGAACSGSSDDILLSANAIADCGTVGAATVAFIKWQAQAAAAAETAGVNVFYDAADDTVASDGADCTETTADLFLGGAAANMAAINDCGTIGAVTVATNLFLAVDAGAADSIKFDPDADTVAADGAVCTDAATTTADALLGGTAAADCEAVSNGSNVSTTYGMLWSDNYSSPHSTKTPDWTNGYLVNDLDTASHTMSY